MYTLTANQSVLIVRSQVHRHYDLVHVYVLTVVCLGVSESRSNALHRTGGPEGKGASERC